MTGSRCSLGPTIAQQSAAIKRLLKRQNKYGNRKTERDGVVYHSAGESRHGQYLELRQAAGEISHLERQKRFDLSVGGQYVCSLIVDYGYFDLAARPNRYVVDDFKGKATPDYAIKAKLFLATHPTTEFREVTKRGTFSLRLSPRGRLLRRRIV